MTAENIIYSTNAGNVTIYSSNGNTQGITFTTTVPWEWNYFPPNTAPTFTPKSNKEKREMILEYFLKSDELIVVTYKIDDKIIENEGKLVYIDGGMLCLNTSSEILLIDIDTIIKVKHVKTNEELAEEFLNNIQ